MDNNELIEIAKQERKKAVVPLSKFKVGACLITKQGKTYLGCNIEDIACLRLGTCAERLAMYKALEAGETEFEKIAVVGGLETDDILSVLPCGICRQFMDIYAPNIIIVYLNKKNEVCEITLKELFPSSFNESFIK